MTTRVCNELQYAMQGMQVGQKAMVSKAHDGPTTRSALLVQQIVNEWAREHNKKPIDVFGGVVLNYVVGGLNPDAVLGAYRLHGKYVWLPTVDAHWDKKPPYPPSFYPPSGPGRETGIELVDENGKVVPALREILALMAETDMVLGLGHESTKHRLIIVDEARKLGLQRIEALHLNCSLTKTTIEEAKEFVRKGALVSLYSMTLRPPLVDWDETMNFVKEVGAENILIASDGGHTTTLSPIEGMRIFITLLLESGVSYSDIELMVKTNPARLLY
jgi:hypothetical protein